jgi:transcriptional regulator with GAF, ATPase, and Fis domain
MSRDPNSTLPSGQAPSNEPQALALIAQSDVMRGILERIDRVAHSDSSVLLIGETGVGKELVAEYVHRTSKRSELPFVKIGLSALPADLLESELFGHEKGAFTSATNEKKGLFELAHTGSIFLDDIDDFPLGLQSKLLRVLESHELMRVGGTNPISVDVRLICASKVDLRELVRHERFRSDLYYRINVVPIIIPPLRERREDIPSLVELFVRRYAQHGPVEISKEAMNVLLNYPWPGNIRELRNVVQRIALFAGSEVSIRDLPAEIRDENPLDAIARVCHRCFVDGNMSFDEVVDCIEVNLLRHALSQTDGNRSQAAKMLRMSLSTLRDKLKKYSLDQPERSPL